MSVRGPRKGENYELSVDLNSEYRDKRKDAIKRTIASMTVGKGAVYNLFRETSHLIDILSVHRRQWTLP
jgi:vesicle coat complex subunit